MLKVGNLTKSFGDHIIFDSVSFSLNPGERAGLVGRNGHGKTTMLRMITGEEHYDDGEISLPKNYTLGYVAQKIDFSSDTVLAEACLGLPDDHHDEKWKAEKILFGLGFTSRDMERNPSEFSGGYQVRLNLAKILVSEPDLLLLDEPTNYLDVVAIRWLSSYLNEWKGELLLVTHDRNFMDSVITDVIGIHRKKIKKIKGTTEKLYSQILKEEEIHEKTRLNDDKKRKEAELFITRFRAKARLAGLVQSRVKALEKKQKLDKLERIKTLDFSFTYEPTPAKVLLNIEDLAFGYDKKAPPLIEGLTFNIGKNDRICVIGRNGKGKTTLLRLLAGELTPDKGSMASHPGLRTGYFAQTNTSLLNNNLSIEQEIINSGCDRQRARDICGAMLFEGDMALKKIGVTSGGEKSRVLLGKILATPANLLLLDEPTNHLDMESCDAFIAAIDSFEGAAVIVTHNEMFLHTLATKFIVFRKNRVFLYEGSYASFLKKAGWEEDEEFEKFIEEKDNILCDKKTVNPLNKKDLRKLKADIQVRRSAVLNPIEKKIKTTEDQIAQLDKRLAENNGEIIRASSSGNGEIISGLSKENHSLQKQLDSLYTELEEFMENHDLKEKEFEKELLDIENI